uniref:Uncharacterized protein n=1 Tax=Arundo donax TaxID=35708 RepID=A0A0A9CVC3_ARUDO
MYTALSFSFIFWSGQICSPGPTQKYLVFLNHGSSYVTDNESISPERK